MNYLSYFKEGFHLLLANLDLAIISILFVTVPFLVTKIHGYPFALLFSLLSVVLAFLSFGYWISVPVFLQARQWKRPMNYQKILNISAQNARRLVKPLIVSIIIAILFWFALAIVLSSVSGKNMQSVISASSSTMSHLFALSLGIFTCMAIFTQFFFSQHNFSFFASLKKSLLFSLAHRGFVLILICMQVSYVSFHSFFPTTSPVNIFLSVVLSPLLTFFLTCSAYIYFEDFSQK